jgi:hypothetical protein
VAPAVVAPTPVAPTATPPTTGIPVPANTPDVAGRPSTSLQVGADSFASGSSRSNNLPTPVVLAPQGTGSGPSLQVIGTVGDRAISIGQANNIPIPAGTFQSTDPQANVTLEATQSDGSPLPVWLKFDSSSGTFTGNPPPDAQGSVNIKVIARDDQGSQAVTEFRVNIGKTTGTESPDGSAAQPAQAPEGQAPDAQPRSAPDAAQQDGKPTEGTPDQRADAEPSPAGKPAFSRQVGAANGNSLAAEAAALLNSLEQMLFG